jgi:hypothetical protein
MGGFWERIEGLEIAEAGVGLCVRAERGKVGIGNI